MNRKELLDSVRRAAKTYGAKKALADALKYSRPTIHNKLKQDDGFTDDELEKAALALYAFDPSAGGLSAGLAEAPSPYSARLESLERELNAAPHVPREDPELAEREPFPRIRRELQAIYRAGDAAQVERETADGLLYLAYGDKEAARRYVDRVDAVAARMRDARELCDKAADIVGWTPPRFLRSTLEGVAFEYGMRLDDLVMLLEASRDAAETPL